MNSPGSNTHAPEHPFIQQQRPPATSHVRSHTRGTRTENTRSNTLQHEQNSIGSRHPRTQPNADPQALPRIARPSRNNFAKQPHSNASPTPRSRLSLQPIWAGPRAPTAASQPPSQPLGGAKLEVRLASPAGLKAGRSVGSFRPGRKSPLAVGWVGRSGRSDPKFSPPRCARRSVGRVVPSRKHGKP